MAYVWCSKEQCRIPSFRCLLCKQECYPQSGEQSENEQALEILLKSGKYEERFVMKRKEKVTTKDSSSSGGNGKEDVKNKSAESAQSQEEDVFLLENGRLKPFRAEDYTSSTLYQRVESYAVECKLVRPEEPAALLYEGKKPSKKSIPIIMTKSDECLLLDSWEELESKPEQLADASEVIGAIPVKQVFVLKRKQA